MRLGFPGLDRVAHRCFPGVGYRGARRLLARMTDALLDKPDRECPEGCFEWVQ